MKKLHEILDSSRKQSRMRKATVINQVNNARWMKPIFSLDGKKSWQASCWCCFNLLAALYILVCFVNVSYKFYWIFVLFRSQLNFLWFHWFSCSSLLISFYAKLKNYISSMCISKILFFERVWSNFNLKTACWQFVVDITFSNIIENFERKFEQFDFNFVSQQISCLRSSLVEGKFKLFKTKYFNI